MCRFTETYGQNCDDGSGTMFKFERFVIVLIRVNKKYSVIGLSSDLFFSFERSDDSRNRVSKCWTEQRQEKEKLTKIGKKN